jgi:photosynthetic reaction center cytochrome c subunit
MMIEQINRRRVKNLLLVLASAFTLIICCTSYMKTNASAPVSLVSNGLAVMQVSQQEKTVEQVRKNIQVLKGLPDSQLFPVMNFIGDSLGVHCDYCHVTQGTDPKTGRDIWLYEHDDKTEKIRGREMIKMVLEINRTSFGGDQQITCYSCHRGTTRVERVVPLPPVDFTLPRTDRKEPAPLSAEQILSNYIKAVGGQDASAKVKTIIYTGIVERSQGRTNAVWQQILPTAQEITIKGPDKYSVKITTPQGITMQGIDGSVGWVSSNNGSRQLSAAELEQFKQTAALYHALKVAEQPAQMRVLGLEKLGDRDVYVVAVTTSPQTTRKYFFDAQTGLLLRRLTTTETMFVPLPEQVDFEDYRDVGGLKLPFTIRTSGLAAFTTATRRFTDIRLNVVVDDSVFKMPVSQK